MFSDDTSGNCSKKWNKFDVVYMILAGMPKEENAKPENIHFVCCSNSTNAVEMIPALVDDLLKLEREGIEVYDGHLERNILLISPAICLLADNPRASELTNHLGASYCRMFMVSQVLYSFSSK